MAMCHQVAVLLAVNEGLFDRIPLEKVKEAEKSLHDYLDKAATGLLKTIEDNGDLDDKTSSKLVPKMKSHLEKFYVKEKKEQK